MKQIFSDTISLQDALNVLMTSLEEKITAKVFFSEKVPISDSIGRITAKPVFARYSSPVYHSAAMDGYAVRFADTFTASETSPCLLKLGEDAIYVDTGEPMPQGFDAVIMIEDVNVVSQQSDDAYIEIYEPATPYQHVRTIGEDIVATELIIPENHVIRPVDVGAMLASGHLDVYVKKRPKIAIIPTGSEMIAPEKARHRQPEPPEIIEYNSAMLSGLVREFGADAIVHPIVRDDSTEIKEAIYKASRDFDIVLVNAGSGKGSEDFTFIAIKELGEVIINGVSIKPGKPFIAGFVNNKPVFGIPGYPVSAFLAFRLFVKPVIARFLGIAPKENERIKAVISRQIASPLGVDEFIRVKIGLVGGKYIATPVSRGAGLLMSVVRADGILKIPAHTEALSAATEVEIELLKNKSEIDNTVVCIGSHDNTLDILANAIKKIYPAFSLSSAHVGSMGGLMALKRGEAHIAGMHLLDEQSGEYNIPFLKRLMPDRRIVLVNLVYRRQGLLVRKGNPKGINSFEDLARDDVMFINRQAGSGTRLLLDKHLREKGINPYLIRGYDKEEYTHMAVASAVLTGLADTGLAVYSSAKALGLDFIAVADERYDLAIPEEFIDMEMIQVVLKIIRENDEFKRTVESLGGYDTRDMGRVIYRS